MMSFDQQADYLAITHSAKSLQSGLKSLQADVDAESGPASTVDLDGLKVLQRALYLRRVQERCEDAIEDGVTYDG